MGVRQAMQQCGVRKLEAPVQISCTAARDTDEAGRQVQSIIWCRQSGAEQRLSNRSTQSPLNLNMFACIPALGCPQAEPYIACCAVQALHGAAAWP